LFKIHPDNDDVFRAILQKDGDGVIVMIDGRVPEWTRRLKDRWSRTMPDVMDRMVFLPSQPNDEYLRLLSISDVVLDPLHFGGGNSSYEALAMETPIITLPSGFLRGRITAALYARMKFTDCVVSTVDDYVALAVKIANDSVLRHQAVEQIRSKSSIVFENIEEVRCFERSLLQCAGRH
jgi:predicted O-linked N-acetylglucosamine transferase (SPINDLY family)